MTSAISTRETVAAFVARTVRRRQALELLAYSGGVSIVLLLLSNWIVTTALSTPPSPYDYGPPIPWDTLALADVLALIVIGAGLIIVAPALVAAHIAGERRAGTLDQLRTTPVAPSSLLAGFLIGPPARIYLLAAGPVGIHLVATITGRVPVDVFAGSMITLLAGTLFATAFGAALALAPRRESGGALIAVGTASLLGIWGFIAFLMSLNAQSSPWAFSNPLGALSSTMLQYDGLWRRMVISPWQTEHWAMRWSYSAPLTSTVWSLATAALLAHAGVRRLASPERPILGKLHAVALFAMFAAAVILPTPSDTFSGYHDGCTTLLIFSMVLLVPLAPIGLLATPSAELWALGRRQRAGAFTDAATPRGAVWLMLAVFAAMAFSRMGVRGFDPGDTASLALAGWLALTLPLYMQFFGARYQTTGARAAFLVGIGAHIVFQMVTIGLVRDHYPSRVSLLVRNLGLLLAVAVPLFTAWRLRVFARRAE